MGASTCSEIGGGGRGGATVKWEKGCVGWEGVGGGGGNKRPQKNRGGAPLPVYDEEGGQVLHPVGHPV
jgi:hypothetical protein